MLLLIDNYDSFTWNLAHRLGELGAEVKVVRNDAVTVDDIDRLAPSRLVISPGPGRPETAGVTVETLRRFAGRLPILGVCLGHQALSIAFGGLASEIEVGRYHSLVIPQDDLPRGFARSAWVTADGTVMGVRHLEWPVFGVQFHPESVLTAVGHRLLQNFLESR
jgi:anthranilate synthase component 2